MHAQRPFPAISPRWFVLAAAVVCAAAPAFADGWIAEANPMTQTHREPPDTDVQTQPGYLISERVPGLPAAFAAAIEDQNSPDARAWRGFGPGALATLSPVTPANGGTVAATGGGQKTATETGFCSTRRCKVLLGASITVAVVLIIGYDTADAIGEGLVYALSVAPHVDET